MMFLSPLTVQPSTTGISYVQKATVQNTTMQDTTVQDTTMQDTTMQKTTVQNTPKKRLRTRKTVCKKTTDITKPDSSKRKEFILIRKKGKYLYCQQMLCNTQLFKHIGGKNFSKKIKTPFGTVTVLFRHCKIGNRYIRFVHKAGSYKKIVNYLKNSVANQHAREIHTIMLNYMTFKPDKNCSLEENLNACCEQICKNHADFFKCINTADEKGVTLRVLSYLCAILTLCDPCYGPGETGGAEIRGFLRKITSCSDCDFDILLNPEKFPLCQKTAYRLFRNYANGEGNETTKKAIGLMMQDMSGVHETSTQSDEGTCTVEGSAATSRQSSQQVIPSSQNFFATENPFQTQNECETEELSAILCDMEN